MRLLLELKTNNKIQNLKVHLIAYLSLKNFFFTLTANVSRALVQLRLMEPLIFHYHKTKIEKNCVISAAEQQLTKAAVICNPYFHFF